MKTRAVLRTIVDSLVLILFVYAAFEAASMNRLARYLPLYVSVAGIVLAAVAVIADFVRLGRWDTSPAKSSLKSGEESAEDDPAQGSFVTTFKLSAYYLAWFLAYAGMVRVIGLIASTAVFLLSFLVVEAKMRPQVAFLFTLIALGTLYGIRELMNLRWPSNVLGW